MDGAAWLYQAFPTEYTGLGFRVFGVWSVWDSGAVASYRESSWSRFVWMRVLGHTLDRTVPLQGQAVRDHPATYINMPRLARKSTVVTTDEVPFFPFR